MPVVAHPKLPSLDRPELKEILEVDDLDLNQAEINEMLQSPSVMDIILSANPYSASIPNSFGRYPLSDNAVCLIGWL